MRGKNTASGAGARSGKVKKMNIKVVVRCRGRNEREVRDCSPAIVQTQGPHTLVVRPCLADKNAFRSYAFDAVYGPDASQQHIFHDVIKPLVGEVQKGYNCTVFCYGQTGTGKTYTMEGDLEFEKSSLNANTGIIPRTLQHIFSELAFNAVEFCVMISYLELYNEELTDLLAPQVNNPRKRCIFDDGSRKGSLVHGPGEHVINSVVEGIRALKEGSFKRQTAVTKRNDNSSRSHTIFTITVYMTTPDAEDLVSIGKLNLVDLAVSENVGRSGAENKREREAGKINQSLLVLGRVINALVEKSAHVPYRESKLTRLFQDSLGGRTKTTIIATISPAKCSMDETLSTLEYASRAKSIRNKPEINQRMKKSALVRQYVAEIDCLKAELKSAREKYGVHLTVESYKSMIDEIRSLKDQMKKTQQQERVTVDQAREKEDHLRHQLRTQELLRREHASTESRLDAVVKGLVMTRDESMADVSSLQAEIERQKIVDHSNLAAHNAFQKDLLVTASELEGSIEKFVSEHGDITTGLARAARSELSHMAEVVEAFSGQHVTKSLDEFSRRVEAAKGVIRKRRRRNAEGDSEIKALCDEFEKYLKDQQKDFRSVHALAVRQLQESFIAQGAVLGNSLSKISAKQEKIRQEVAHHMSAQRKAIKGMAEHVRLDTVEGMGCVKEVTQYLEDFAESERRQAEDARQQVKKRVEALITEFSKFSESQAQRIDCCVAAVTDWSRACERKIEASAQWFAGLSNESLGRLDEGDQNIAATIKDSEQDAVDSKLVKK